MQIRLKKNIRKKYAIILNNHNLFKSKTHSKSNNKECKRWKIKMDWEKKNSWIRTFKNSWMITVRYLVNKLNNCPWTTI
jgi:hypothetical protein